MQMQLLGVRVWQRVRMVGGSTGGVPRGTAPEICALSMKHVLHVQVLFLAASVSCKCTMRRLRELHMHLLQAFPLSI